MHGRRSAAVLFLSEREGKNGSTFRGDGDSLASGWQSRVDAVNDRQHNVSMRKVFLVGFLGVLGVSSSMAELGKSLADLKILKNLAVVRETLLYNRTFVLAVAEDKATTGRQAQYLFLSGECPQI